MAAAKKKEIVRIARARRFKDRLEVAFEEKGQIAVVVNISNPKATLEEIEEAARAAFYTEVGTPVPGLVGTEIEVEYEIEEA